MNVVYIILALVACVLIYGAHRRSKDDEAHNVAQGTENYQHIMDDEVDFIRDSLKMAYNSEYCYDVLKKRLVQNLERTVSTDRRLIGIASILTIAYMQGETFEDANKHMQNLAKRFIDDADLHHYTWTLMGAFGITVAAMKDDKLLNLLIVAANPEWLIKMIESDTKQQETDA